MPVPTRAHSQSHQCYKLRNTGLSIVATYFKNTQMKFYYIVGGILEVVPVILHCYKTWKSLSISSDHEEGKTDQKDQKQSHPP